MGCFDLPNLPSGCNSYDPPYLPMLGDMIDDIVGHPVAVEIESITNSVVGLGGAEEEIATVLSRVNTVRFTMSVPKFYKRRPRYKRKKLKISQEQLVDQWTNVIIYYEHFGGLFCENLDKLKSDIRTEYKIKERVARGFEEFAEREDQNYQAYKDSFIKTKNGWIHPEHYIKQTIEIEYRNEDELRNKLEYHCLKLKNH